MQFILKKSSGDSATWLRSLGYHFQEKDKEKKELTFYHPLTKFSFPRFHLYLRTKGDNLIFNLHLDQKGPIYKGAPAHSAEYEGLIIKKEAERIKKNLGR